MPALVFRILNPDASIHDGKVFEEPLNRGCHYSTVPRICKCNGACPVGFLILMK